MSGFDYTLKILEYINNTKHLLSPTCKKQTQKTFIFSYTFDFILNDS